MSLALVCTPTLAIGCEGRQQRLQFFEIVRECDSSLGFVPALFLSRLDCVMGFFHSEPETQRLAGATSEKHVCTYINSWQTERLPHAQLGQLQRDVQNRI